MPTMEPTGTTEASVAALLVFTAQAAILYLCGSYATGRALALAGGGKENASVARAAGRALFYVLVMPGVVLHESAHYLACILTGTRVGRFAPFAPRQDGSGRLILGYVSHEKRATPVMALIGLAPMVLNPVGILAATVLFTPLSPIEVLVSPALSLQSLLNDGFVGRQPLVAAGVTYLLISFAVGSVPSWEDLTSVPAALFLFALVIGGFVLLGGGDGLLLSVANGARHATGLYTLPALVALVAAVTVWLAGLFSKRV